MDADQIPDVNEQNQELFIELTPEQESEQLVSEFSEFSQSLEKTLPYIPDDKKDVKEKVERLCVALTSLDKEDILVLFNAMDQCPEVEFVPVE